MKVFIHSCRNDSLVVGELPREERSDTMTATHQSRRNEPSARRKTDRYAVVVATKGEGIDVVLRGISADQAERIAARKNPEMDEKSSVHAVSETQFRKANSDLHRILTA